MEMEKELVQPGFRFYPTEEELVDFYLHCKLQGHHDTHINTVIPLVSIYDVEPWQLPKMAGERCVEDREQWFFFTARQEREEKGERPKRTTKCGYWKATGSPGYVYSSNNKVIGVKKTMVFYKGKAPCGKKTKWKMNEYKAIHSSHQSSNIAIPKLRHEFSLCRVYVISGIVRAFDRRPLSSLHSSSSHKLITTASSSDDIQEQQIQQPQFLWDWELLNWP